MRQFDTHPSATAQVRALADTATEQQDRMGRGLVHGAILALAVWVGAAYLAFILR
jgi:hypothetical protein